jgi:tRNA pseudouridine55 synthase
MDGVLVIDKPQGLTSHDVVTAARRCLGERRIGHTGTLDPLATGVLPLACGRATRLVRFLSSSDKDYEASIRFGLETVSYDGTGAVVARSDRRPARDAVEAALASLRGDYLQTPPAYSAKKVAGRRAYAMAREQTEVVLTPVPVRVARADLLSIEDGTARVAITCSAGFYVRSFAHELGRRVGTGACLDALRRTRSGEFGLDAAIGIDALTRGDGPPGLIPLERVLPALPSARLTETGCARVSHGQSVDARHLASDPAPALEAGSEAWIRLFDTENRLVAMARPGSAPGTLHPAVVLT